MPSRTCTASEGGVRAGAVAVLMACASLPVFAGMTLTVALPGIAADLRASAAASVAIVAVYFGVQAVAQPLTGALADRAGAGRAIKWGLWVMAGGSACAAVSPTLPVLLAARSAQAVGVALVVPSVHALLAADADRDGRRFGWATTLSNVVAAVGPLVGALVVAHAGWRGVFGASMALAAGTVLVASRFLPGGPSCRPAPREPGVALPARPAPRRPPLPRCDARRPPHPGARSRQRPAAGPLGQAMRDRRCVAATGVGVLDNLVMQAVLLGVPFAVAASRPSAAAGLAVFALAGAAAAPLGGRLADRAGRGVAVRTGFLLSASGLVGLHQAASAPGDAMLAALVVVGVGLGLAFPGVQALPLAVAPAGARSAVAGVVASARQAGGLAGALAVSAAVAGQPALVFLVGAAAAVVAAALSVVADPLPGGASQAARPGSRAPSARGSRRASPRHLGQGPRATRCRRSGEEAGTSMAEEVPVRCTDFVGTRGV